MIVVKLMGGLGNQMFQYAFSRELARLYQENVVYDLSSYSTDKKRQLGLYKLNVPTLVDWENVLPLKIRKNIILEEKIYRIIQRGMRFIHRSDRVGEKLYNFYLYRGRYYSFDPYFYSVPKLSDDLKVAYGYFQGENYFKNSVEEIKKRFVVSKPVEREEQKILDLIHSTNSVCVHIRMGDYLDRKNIRFNTTSPEYFQRGIKYMKEKMEKPVFFVFTNDEQAIKENCQINDCIVVKGFKDYQDLRLMCACKHFVISNSTFSWWASYLSQNTDKQVIVPLKWRRNQEQDPALLQTESIQYIKL